MKTAIIIPSHLNAKRLPNKPLLLINNEPMILHVWRQAKKTNIDSVIVATSDKEIFDVITSHGGIAIITRNNHTNGSDRIFEAIETLENKPELIINVQGDMPLIKPEAISHLEKFMKTHSSEMGTLASKLDEKDVSNPDIVKVETQQELKLGSFSQAVDFFRIKEQKSKKLYHHVGIYGYQYSTLKHYVGLHKTKNELERSLEQMRALDNNITIQVGFIQDYPLGVDTQEDLEQIRLLYNEK